MSSSNSGNGELQNEASNKSDDHAAEDDVEMPQFSEHDAARLKSGIENLAKGINFQIDGSWRELPDWLRNDLPFEEKLYFGIPESEDGSVHYLTATLLFEPRNHYFKFKNAVSHHDLSESQKQTFDLCRVRQKLNYYLWKLETRNSASYAAGLNRFLKSYEGVFTEIAQAQEFKSRHRAQNFQPLSLDPTWNFTRSFAGLIQIRNKASLEDYDAIFDLEIGLRAARDFAKLESFIGHLNGCGAENILLKSIAMPYIQNSDSITQIDRLLEVLKEHSRESKKICRFTESTRNEYLTFRALLRHLQSNQPFDLDDEDFGVLGVDTNTPAPLIAHKIMELQFYPGNDQEIAKSIELAADLSGKTVESVKETIDAVKLPFDNGQAEMALLMPEIFKSVASMKDADFEREYEILIQRCKDVDKASSAPFPNRIKQMEQLEFNWTADGNLDGSKFLKWYKPRAKIVAAELRNDVRTRGQICLAALRRYQLLHNEKPSSLEEALQLADVDPQNVVDPFTGNAFKILPTAKCAVYSPGPDLIDDKGASSVENIDTRADLFGDIIFDLYADHSAD